MEIQDLANLILNSSVSIAVIGYFMYRDFRFMSSLQTTLVTLVDTVSALKDCVNELRRKEVGEDGN